MGLKKCGRLGKTPIVDKYWNMNSNKYLYIIIFLFFFVVFPKNLYAYIDPGAGSIILQLIIAGILGGIYMIKIYLKKIRILSKSLFFRKKDNDGK